MIISAHIQRLSASVRPHYMHIRANHIRIVGEKRALLAGKGLTGVFLIFKLVSYFPRGLATGGVEKIKNRATSPVVAHGLGENLTRPGARNRKIFDMWMACYTEEEIAEACGCSQTTVDRVLPEMADLPKRVKSDRAKAEHLMPLLPLVKENRELNNAESRLRSGTARCVL